MSFVALDLETAPAPGCSQVYALQPWRAKEGTAKITSVSIAEPGVNLDGAPNKPHIIMPEDIELALAPYVGGYVVTWNGVFDVAWLLASGFEKVTKRIRWLDAMLLWKWLENGQMKELIPHWSLVHGVKRWLDSKEYRWVVPYIKMKENEPPAGEKDEYWRLRAQFDALATQKIAEKVWPLLTARQQKSALIEAMCILPVASSWLTGITLDTRLATEMMPAITDEMIEIEQRLGVANKHDVWTPSKILSSPKQLSETLYDKWKLPILNRTPKGAPSSDKATLTYLADHDDKVLHILRWRELNTQFTKFIRGISKTKTYLQSDICHPQPKLFSTYTGRMTYASKSGGKGEAAKAKIGVPIHQWPRPKALRRIIKAPAGKVIVEFDASGQEMRFMGCASEDPTLLQIFNAPPPYDDIHSFMGARLAGMNFEAFLKCKAEGVASIVGPTGYRNQGKFNNLSSQYRIGLKKLRIKSRVDYGMNVDFMTIKRWNTTYHQTLKGVSRYWRAAIAKAKIQGYAESFAGRRFKLEFWDSEDKDYATQQSAINFPIQASGGDQKELALALLTSKFPQLEFFMDLHDGLYFYADISKNLPDLLNEARNMLNSIDYEKYWGWKPIVPLVWDCSLGTNWGNKVELKVKS